MKTLSVHTSARRTPLVDKAIELLERYLREHHGLRLEDCRGGARLTLDIQAGMGAEGFRVEDDRRGGVRLVGNDENGLLYAVGKYLRLPEWRGVSVPEKPVRAIYFATHFHNFYHDAPIEKVCRYVEELALWGCNTLTVWFDMHHYCGIADPAARSMVARLRAILRSAESVGMRPGLMLLANEAYADSPAELRADWRAGQNGYFAEPVGHYHVEICPGKPGGLEQILRDREEMLEAFEGVNPSFIVIWPYDQGGCTCATCAPWGPNGYLKVAEPLARLLRRRRPDAKIVLSTWYFDQFVKGEWAGLDRTFAARKPDWVDFLLADDGGGFPEYPLRRGMPGGLPALNFPEISMSGMGPWGAYGANPRLTHWQDYWNRSGALLSGGFPYSEGIFEDINKVLHLQLNWGGRSTREIALEYAAGEYAADVAGDVVEAMLLMEQTLDHNADVVTARGVLESGGWERVAGKPPLIHHLNKVVAPERYAGLLRTADARLPAAARSAWRWRILFLRALLDEELSRSGGRPTTESDAFFAELTRIYHAENAELIVSPVGRAELTRLRDQLPNTSTRMLAPSPPDPWRSPFLETWSVSTLQPKTVAAAPARGPVDPLEWQVIPPGMNPPGFVNVHPIVGNDDGIVYLAARVRVAKAGCWILHIGHDGGVRVFVDGRVVITAPERINPAPVKRSRARLSLDKGVHEIMIAFDTAKGKGWGIFCTFEIPKSARKGRARPVFPEPIIKPHLQQECL